MSFQDPVCRHSFAILLALVTTLSSAGMAGAQTTAEPEPALRPPFHRGFAGVGFLGSLDRTNEADRTASWRPALAGHAGWFLNRNWTLRAEVEVPATMTIASVTGESDALLRSERRYTTRQVTLAGLFGYERDMSARVRLAGLLGGVIGGRSVRSDETRVFRPPVGFPFPPTEFAEPEPVGRGVRRPRRGPRHVGRGHSLPSTSLRRCAPLWSSRMCRADSCCDQRCIRAMGVLDRATDCPMLAVSNRLRSPRS